MPIKKIKTHRAMIITGILLATFVCFAPVLQNQFTNWDNPKYLMANPRIRSLNMDNIRAIFTSSIFQTYSPLTQISFAVEYAITGYHPFLYHLDNLILHLGVVSLAFLFARECGLSQRASGLTALLFAVHPLHVEPVAWGAARKDVLYGVFYMASLWSYMQYLKTRRSRFYLLSLAAGLASILAKAMALSLPLILLLCDWFMGRKWTRKMVMEKLPFFLYIIPITLITYSQQARNPLLENIFHSVLIWVWCMVFYINKFLWPWTLIPIYELPEPVGITNAVYTLALAQTLAIVVLLIRFRRNRLWVFSFLFYLASIFFLFRMDRHDGVITADRFMYLPSLGFCMLAGAALDGLINRVQTRPPFVRKGTTVMIAALFVLLAGKTSRQTLVWRDPFTLWQTVLKHWPNQGQAYNNLAAAYLKQEDYPQALRMLEAAARLEPGWPTTNTNLGSLYRKLGRLDEAEQRLRQALAIAPQYAPALNNLGLVLWDAGRIDEAQEVLQRAIRNDPEAFESRLNLAMLLRQEGQTEAAAALYRANLSIDPKDKISREGLLRLYLAAGQKEAARQVAEELLRSRPTANDLVSAGSLFAVHQDDTMAYRLYTQALADDPGCLTGYLELGKLLGHQGRIAQAVTVWETGASLAPRDPRFQELLTQVRRLRASQAK